MATIAFQLTVAQQAAAERITSNPANTAVNSNQAQGASEGTADPQDIVTFAAQPVAHIAAQINDGQQNSNQVPVVAVYPALVAFGVGNPATGTAAPLHNAGGGITTQSAQQSQEQQLQQLDQTLQQLGVDPQSLSLFSQLALLPYANDPAILQQFVQQLQQSTQQVLQQGIVGAQTKSQLTLQPQVSSTQASQPTTKQQRTPSLDLVEPAAGAAYSQSTNAPSPTATPPIFQNNSPPQPAADAFNLAFQQLQSTLAVLGGQLPPSTLATVPSQAQSLNVTF